MIYMFFLATCINEQSPGIAGRLLVMRRVASWVQLLHVGSLFHVHLVAVLVIEMMFKV